MKNIYDLEGNYKEWTAMASGQIYRISFGGHYSEVNYLPRWSASDSTADYPTHTSGQNSSRSALYVNL